MAVKNDRRQPLCRLKIWGALRQAAGMSTLVEIGSAIVQLPLSDAEILQEWLEQWLEDHHQMTPEFLASIESGKADLAAGRQRVVRP